MFTYRERDEVVKEKERKTKFDERHWLEKSLPEMADRDWRIFREDYNIATKGGRIPFPLRSWGEAGLSGDILEVIHSLNYKVDRHPEEVVLMVPSPVHRNPHQSNDKPFPLGYRTEISLA